MGLPVAAVPDPALGAAVCAALRAQVAKLGLSIGDEPDWSVAVLEERRDPYSQECSLLAFWRGGARYGMATFFPDGRIFAEYQVLLPHPAQPDAYVEAVQVWGLPGQLRGDAVLVEYAK